MIPILYEKNETAFTSNGICRLRDCLSCVVTEERNGIYECDFDYPVTGAHYDEIVCGRIIAVTHDDSGDIQPFDIVGYTAPINGVVSFHAVHISYRLNQISSIGIEYINGRRSFGQMQALTPDDIMTLVKNGFQAMGQWVMYPSYPSCPFDFVTDITRTDVLMFENNEPLTVRQILGGKEGGILDRFHCEFEFDRWTVHMWSNRGQQRDFVIRYGLNMTEYNDEADTSEAYNSVAPYWKNDNTLKQIQHIDSGQSLPSGRVACVPLDLSGQFSEEPTTAQLTSAARSYMTTNRTYNPAETINVSFVRLQDSEEYEQYQLLMQCGLCDTITVKFPMYGMSSRMKIVKVEYDVLRDQYNSMELGELSTTLSQALGVSGGSSYSGSSGGGGGGLSINDIYPVGSIYMSVNATNPSTLFAGTTWERITGKFLLGATDDGASGGNSTASVVAGGTGGEATHTLTHGESGVPSHSHTYTRPTVVSGGGGHSHTVQSKYRSLKVGTSTSYNFWHNDGTSTGNISPGISSNTGTHTHTLTGGGVADNTAANASSGHNNMPPYLSVYIWKRTA